MNLATATLLGIFYSVPPIPSLPAALGGKLLGIEKFFILSCEFFYAEGFKDGLVAGVALAMVVSLVRYVVMDFRHIWMK